MQNFWGDGPPPNKWRVPVMNKHPVEPGRVEICGPVKSSIELYRCEFCILREDIDEIAETDDKFTGWDMIMHNIDILSYGYASDQNSLYPAHYCAMVYVPKGRDFIDFLVSSARDMAFQGYVAARNERGRLMWIVD